MFHQIDGSRMNVNFALEFFQCDWCYRHILSSRSDQRREIRPGFIPGNIDHRVEQFAPELFKLRLMLICQFWRDVIAALVHEIAPFFLTLEYSLAGKR